MSSSAAASKNPAEKEVQIAESIMKYAERIRSMCRELKLSACTVATAIYYFRQIFDGTKRYTKFGMKGYNTGINVVDKHDAVVVCIQLAMKTEDSENKHNAYILKHFVQILWRDDRLISNDATRLANRVKDAEILEKLFLTRYNYELNIDLPYYHLGVCPITNEHDKDSRRQIIAEAWADLDDLILTRLITYYSGKELAVLAVNRILRRGKKYVSMLQKFGILYSLSENNPEKDPNLWYVVLTDGYSVAYTKMCEMVDKAKDEINHLTDFRKNKKINASSSSAYPSNLYKAGKSPYHNHNRPSPLLPSSSMYNHSSSSDSARKPSSISSDVSTTITASGASKNGKEKSSTTEDIPPPPKRLTLNTIKEGDSTSGSSGSGISCGTAGSLQ